MPVAHQPLNLARSNYVLRYCWLANTTGKAKAFLPFDLLQEHNIRDIKVSCACCHPCTLNADVHQVIFGALGPFATWEYIGRISPAIPFLRRLKDLYEHEINHYARGKSHTDPDKEADVQRLMEAYKAVGVHCNKPGRKLPEGDRVPDCIQLGLRTAQMWAATGRWAENRLQERSTEEIIYQSPAAV